jgi:hypothetical protein
MGDRGVIAITTEPHTPALQITTHWGGADIADAAEFALRHAQPRWTDPTYCPRILVQAALQHLGADIHNPLEHGLAIGGACETNRPVIVIDIPNQRVAILGLLEYLEATDGLNTGNWNLTESLSFEAASQPGALHRWFTTGEVPQPQPGS